MTIQEQVENLLRKHPKSMDDDRELFLAWIFYYENITEEEKIAFGKFKDIIRRMPALESLTRARRDLQLQNPYLRGPKYKARQTREKQVRSFYRNK